MSTSIDLSTLDRLKFNDLPSGYVRINYIESNGNQYIDTGFKPNQNTRVRMKVNSYGTYAYFFGCWNSAYNNGAFAVGNDGSNVYSGYDGQGGGSGTVQYCPSTTIELNKNIVYINDEVFRTFTASTFQVNYNLYLFTQNRSGTALTPTGARTTTTSMIQCEYCKIWDNDVLVRDFVPALRKSDNALGMYDKVNKVFYGNAGTGSFSVYDNVSELTGCRLYNLNYAGNNICNWDYFVANIYVYGSTEFGINILAIGNVSITFNGETKSVSASTSSQSVIFTKTTEDINSDLIIIGQFSSWSIYYNKDRSKYTGDINYIKFWFTNNTLPDKILYLTSSSSVTRKDILIPNTIKYIDTIGNLTDSSHKLVLPKGLIRLNSSTNVYSNAVVEDNVIYIDDVATSIYNLSSSNSPTSVTIRNGTRLIACYFCQYATMSSRVSSYTTNNSTLTSVTLNTDGALKSIPQYFLTGATALTSVNIPDSVITIGKRAFDDNEALASIVIPSSVKTIEDEAFYSGSSTSKLLTITFNHTNSDEIELGSKVFYTKGTVSRTLYTDNKYVGDYVGAANSYHLDGTSWTKLSTPTISASSNILTISNIDSNTEYYYITITYINEIYSGNITSTTFDFSSYVTTGTSYTIKVTAKTSNNNIISSSTASLSYTAE